MGQPLFPVDALGIGAETGSRFALLQYPRSVDDAGNFPGVGATQSAMIEFSRSKFGKFKAEHEELE